MKKEIYANFRNAKIVKLMKIEVNEGEGTADDPITRVAYLVDFNGNVVAKIGENKDRKFVGTDEMVMV